MLTFILHDDFDWTAVSDDFRFDGPELLATCALEVVRHFVAVDALRTGKL